MPSAAREGFKYTDSDQFVRIAFLTSLTYDPVTSMVPMGLIIAIEDDTHLHVVSRHTNTREKICSYSSEHVFVCV